MHLPYQRQTLKSRTDVVQLLDLASTCCGDEITGYTYTFDSPLASVELLISYGMELEIKLWVEGDAAPVAEAKLLYCEEIRTMNERNIKFIEFIGQFESTNNGPRRVSLLAGFRLSLKPSISLKMFFDPEPWSHE